MTICGDNGIKENQYQVKVRLIRIDTNQRAIHLGAIRLNEAQSESIKDSPHGEPNY